MTKLTKLDPFDGDHIRMVVETPKGSLVKLEYDEQLGHFTISHGLALGIAYPFEFTTPQPIQV